jgi:hypothetical protein
MGEPENITQREIVGYCGLSVYKTDFPDIEFMKIYRTNNISIKGRANNLPPGYPDFTGFIKLKNMPWAIPLFVECKALGMKCESMSQIHLLYFFKQNGAIAFWSDSLSMFKEKLKEQLYGKQ